MKAGGVPRAVLPDRPDRSRPPTLALISHDEMKREWSSSPSTTRRSCSFSVILATGTTRRTGGRSGALDCREHPPVQFGPQGWGYPDCHRDPLRPLRCGDLLPGPHAPPSPRRDIRVVLGACMVENSVQILTNEAEARGWMDTVVRQGRLSEAIRLLRTVTPYSPSTGPGRQSPAGAARPRRGSRPRRRVV